MDKRKMIGIVAAVLVFVGGISYDMKVQAQQNQQRAELHQEAAKKDAQIKHLQDTVQQEQKQIDDLKKQVQDAKHAAEVSASRP